jgi:ribonucleoside-diphosphate reductase alpha chain
MAKAKSGNWWESEGQRALANNSAVYNSKPNTAQFLREWRNLYESKSGERGIYNMDSVRKHIDRFERRDSSRVMGTNPCGEILLRPNEFCNLTEVVIEASDTKEDLAKKIKYATVLGTWQSTLTNFKYIRKSWKDNCEEERLLGVSLTGIFGNKITATNGPELAKMLDELREQSVKSNVKEAELLGINPSASITCVKPSGTVSQLTGVSSGIHPWYSPYYLRSVRGDNKDPLTTFLKESGIPNEPDVMKPNDTTVFYFPIQAPKDAVVTKDLTAIDHLEIWKTYRENWTEHNPSVTVNIHEDEWLRVGAWVYDNFDSVGGVSFLPASEHTYKQAPYQEISETEYKEWVKKMPTRIDWNMLTLYETVDTTTGSQELSCTAGACEVVDISSSAQVA